MNTVTFTQSALKRIANIQSVRFTDEETAEFQVQLIETIRTRLSTTPPQAGYHEQKAGLGRIRGAFWFPAIKCITNISRKQMRLW